MLLVVLVMLAGCGSGDGGGEEAGHLEQALAMVPADSSRIYFTDWELIKAYEGFPELSSERPMDERMSFMKAFIGDVATGAPPRQAVLPGYGYNRFLIHAETWSWDSTDLVWEVSLERGSAPPAYVLQLRDDFDFGPLLELFEERGYGRSERQGVTVFSHDMDLEQEWVRKSEFGILNTAVMVDERRLVLSSALEGVQAIVDVIEGGARSLAEDPAAAATAERLGEVAAAYLSAGPTACMSSGDPLQAWSDQGMGEEQLAQMRELMEEVPPVHFYSGLGLGYRYEKERPLGLVVMHYPRTEEAEGDLETRRRLAEEGSSLAFEGTLREAVFTLEGAAVEGSDLVLRVRPVDDMPRRLFEMVFQRDMVFAGCP
jgi:hypothetical protein